MTLTNCSGRRQSFEPIAIQMQKKKLSVGFAKIARPGLTQRLFSTFYHPHCNKFTLRTSENSRRDEFLFHDSNRHVSKLNLYIFSALRKYLPLKSPYFFDLCLAAKQPYLIPFSMVGHTCMAGTSRAQHYLRRAFARCSVSPQVRFISLSSARCSSPSAFSATQRSFYGVDSILAQSWESPDFPYMPYPTHLRRGL